MEVKTEYPLRFGIVPTYKCNLACQHCNRQIDLFPWQESELSVSAVKTAGLIVRGAGLDVLKIRLTGGEPTMHPQMREIVREIQTTWQPTQMTVVMSNLTKKSRPNIGEFNARYCHGTHRTKIETHQPWMISPHDLGIKSQVGVEHDCFIQKGCGRLFDAFGFSFCIFAGAMGRLLRIDPYSNAPVLCGREDICKHCVCSLYRSNTWAVWKRAAAGEIKAPTKTYQDGIAAFKEKPFTFKKFEDRTS